MARLSYGGGADDIIVSPVTIDSVQVAGLPASVSFQVWNLANTSQLTGIVDAAGSALPSNLVTTSSSGQIPTFQGPDGYTGSLRLKHTGTGVTWILHPHDTGTAIPATLVDAKGDLLVGTAADTVGRLAAGSNGQVLTADSTVTAGVKWATPSGGGGGSAELPDTLVVAAAGSGVTGDYTCDGTADDVQINAALTELRSGSGGTVLLTAGTFNLAAPILVEGFDDVDVEQDLYLRGAGPANTSLVVGAGVSCGVRLGKSVRAHVWDLGLTIDGASDGIQAVASTEEAGIHRSAWMSTIARIQVLGPFDGGDTGWALDLDNVFRASIYDVEVNGTTNGIRWLNSTAEFNGGDSLIARCFVDIGNGAASGTAYAVESTAGNMNQLTFLVCHGIGNPAVAGQVCWKFSGAGNTSHVRTVGCNAEQFATTVQTTATTYDIDVDLVHVTLRNGSVLADLDGYGSRVRCGLAYVEPSATVTLVDDDNTYSAKPNVFGPVDVYADTGSTVTADVTDTVVLRDITYDGPGTFPAAARQPPAVAQRKPLALTDGATITIDASRGDDFRVTLGGNRTMAAPTNPTDGQRVTILVSQDGTGSRTLTWNAVFTFGTITNALTATANRRDLFDFVYNAGLTKWLVVGKSANLT